MSIKAIVHKAERDTREVFEFDVLPRKGEQMMLPGAFGTFDVYEVTWVQHWPIHEVVALEPRVVLFAKYIANWDGED